MEKWEYLMFRYLAYADFAVVYFSKKQNLTQVLDKEQYSKIQIEARSFDPSEELTFHYPKSKEDRETFDWLTGSGYKSNYRQPLKFAILDWLGSIGWEVFDRYFGETTPGEYFYLRRRLSE